MLEDIENGGKKKGKGDKKGKGKKWYLNEFFISI